MKQMVLILLAVGFVVLLAGCAAKHASNSSAAESKPAFIQISQQDAKKRMEIGDVLVLDVRRQDEYDASHIPGAVLLPVETITAHTAEQVIPTKDTEVLIYCRSGNRSKQAGNLLADLGYTNLYEFGGINTWPYEVE